MSDRRRKLVFASAALVLLGITAFSTLREPGPPPRHDARPQQPADSSGIRTQPLPGSEFGQDGETHEATPRSSAEPPTSSSSPAATEGEGEAKSPPAVAPRKARAATAAARAFLDGYLPYSYGRAPRRDAFERQRPSLLRELEASPPRVPASVARTRPRLISVRAEAATGGSNVDVRGCGRGRTAAVPHPARRAPRRPPLDRDSGPRLTRVSVVVQPRVARRLIAAGAAAIALLGLLLVLLVATLMGGLAPPNTCAPGAGTRYAPSPVALADIPGNYLQWIRQAGTGMGWTGA